MQVPSVGVRLTLWLYLSQFSDVASWCCLNVTCRCTVFMIIYFVQKHSGMCALKIVYAS